MKAAFADAFYFFALLNARDECHERAHAWTASYKGRIVTTDWVLLELADGMAASRQRTLFPVFRRDLLANSHYRILPCDPTIHEQGIHLFEARSDKEWSLTDCTSFVVMEQEQLTEALTGDHHFEQAGFRALLA